MASGATAFAADGTWNVNGSGLWSTPANWLGGVPTQAGDVATFGDAIAQPVTVSVDGSYFLGGMVFDNDYSVTVGGFGAFRLGAPGANGFIRATESHPGSKHTVAARLLFVSDVDVTNDNGDPLTLSGVILGSGGMRKAGPGDVVVSGDNGTWSGDVVVSEGTLRAVLPTPPTSTGPYRGLGTGAVRVAGTAMLDLDVAAHGGTGVFANDVTLSGGYSAINSLTTARYGSTVLTGAITLEDDAVIRAAPQFNGDFFHLAIGDPTTGDGALRGAGELTLMGSIVPSVSTAVQLNVRAAHTGGTRLDRVLLDVSPLGSLAGTGDVTVGPKSTLRLTRPAGTDPATASVSPNAVVLQGGTLDLADVSPAGMLSPLSSGGTLGIHSASFTAGGTNLIDFGEIPGGDRLRVIATQSGSRIAAGVVLKPDPVSHTLHFGESQWDLAVDGVIADRDLAATHVEQLSGTTFSGQTVLGGANTYTGQTLVRAGGVVRVTHANGLGAGTGTDADGTTIDSGGEVVIAPGVTIEGEQFRLAGGKLSASETSVINGPVVIDPWGGTIAGGDYRGVISGNSTALIASGPGGAATFLRGANTFTGGAYITGGRVEVHHAQGLGISANAGARTVVSNRGDLRMYAASDAPIEVQSNATLHLGGGGGGAAHAERISLYGGTLTSDAGTPFAGTLEMRGGVIDADLVSSTTITLTFGGDIKGLGKAFDGTVRVTKGRLGLYGDALGSTVGHTIVDAATGAYIEVRDGTRSAEPIDLNNAIGDGTGGLVGKGTFPITLSGPITLGDRGSAIGVIERGDLTLAGPISGGSLTVNGGYETRLRLTNAAVNYTGQTRVNGGGTLLVGGAGRLANTSDVYLAGGSLQLDNSGLAQPDRLPDHVPITLAGGTFGIAGDETVGTVHLERGANFMGVSNTSSDATTPSRLTITRLTRNPGATVEFSASADNPARLYLAIAPALNNGMIGGWATTATRYAATRFAGYGTNGVVPLVGSTTDVNVANAGTNLELAASATPIMTANRAVNSLRMDHSAALNLGGYTLSVDSGGVIAYYDPNRPSAAAAVNISNGTIVPGPVSSDLFLYGGSYAARIADAAANRPTSVIASGVVHLSGANTYTGTTYVEEWLYLEAPGALSAGSDLTLDDSRAFVSYASTSAVRLDRLTMTGLTGTASFAGGVPLNANEYLIDAGRIEGGLAGGGTLTKQSDRQLTITGDNANFSGAVNILAGSVTVDAPSLGTGLLRIEPGAQLSARGLDNSILMNGGGIGRLNFSTPAGIRGPVRVVGDATIGGFTVSGPLTVEAGGTLGGGSLTLTGDVRVDGAITGYGVNVTPAAGRSVSGRGTIAGSVVIGAGAKLSGDAADGLTIDGNLTLSAVAVTRVALSAASPAAGPAVAVTGTATLAGTLEVAADGFTPAPLGSYTVLSYGGRSGRYAAFAGLDVPGPLALAPVYAADALRLVATLPGDADLDGRVAFADLLTLARNYNGSATAATDNGWSRGDFTYDGLVGFPDLIALARNYGGQLNPAMAAPFGPAFQADVAAAVALVQVPEPGLVGGLLPAAALLLRRRSRRTR